MAKIIIYGAGDNGKRIYNDDLCGRDDVVCFVDSAANVHGRKIGDINIVAPCDICNYIFDYVIISVGDTAQKSIIVDNLVNKYNIPIEKIEEDYSELVRFRRKARMSFLRCFAEYAYKNNINGSVAEAGVYKGDFSRWINLCFPDRLLYLFDTFAGFTDYDIEAEKEVNPTFDFPIDFRDNSVEYIMSVMPNINMVSIHKGHFPETANEIDDSFAFVNLDLDLYKPTLDGLEYFYPRMVHHGIIMVHDYFRKDLAGVELAVHEYCNKEKILFHPCSDECSIIIVKG